MAAIFRYNLCVGVEASDTLVCAVATFMLRLMGSFGGCGGAGDGRSSVVAEIGWSFCFGQ